MANPAQSTYQNLLPVQAYFALDGTFQTFIGQGQPFYATVNPFQSGLHITNSTIDSTTIGATTPSTGVFTSFTTTSGDVLNTPTGNFSLVNKGYVDAVATGLNPKAPVAVISVTNITLSGLQTIDGYTTQANDRVLVIGQTNQANNGIYAASSGAWTRTTDANTWALLYGAYVLVDFGNSYAGSAWVNTSPSTGTLGTTPINFVQFANTAIYTAGTGLTLAAYQFSITPVGTAGTYGSASQVPVFVTNASGQVTSVTNTPIAISASQITSGTISSSLISGSYTGITGVGTLTAGTWNASTVGVAYGGTGATTLTGYVKGSGTSAFTASTTIPTTDLSGQITNAQLQNSTISGVSLGSNLFSLTIGSGLLGTSYNGSAAVTIANSAPMVYPPSGIPSSTGTAWNTSYSTTGSGTVLALATGPTLNNPTISNYATFTPSGAPAYAEGRTWYDSGTATLSYFNDTTSNIVRVGAQLQQQVRNSTGSTITKGQVVYISGSTGQIGNIILAQANAYNTSQVIGITVQDIPNNTNGYVVIYGTVENINTSGLTAGQNIYLSATTPGALTQTEPSAPNYAVHMGVCLYSNTNNGKLLIVPDNKSVDTGYIIGQVAIAQGGTNGTATPTAGAVAYGTGTAYAFTSAGTTGQVLQSNGTSAPTWVTPVSYATVTDDTTTASTRYPLFANQTTGNLTTEYTSSTKLQYVPSTGTLTATVFSGSGAGLTSIPNSALTNSSITVGSTTISLGGSSTTLAGLTSVTSTTFVGALSGNASTATTATNATNIAVTDNTSSSSTFYPVIASATTGNVGATTSSTKLTFTPSTGTLTATAIDNTVIGGVTPAAGTFTTLTATGESLLGLNGANNQTFRSTAGTGAFPWTQTSHASGDARIRASAATGNSNFSLSSLGTSAVRFYTNAFTDLQFQVSNTASAVNYVQVTGAATGSFPIISAQGSDATLGLNLYSKGAARINFFNNNGTNRQVSIGGNGTTAVNYIGLDGSIAGSAPVVSVAGTDTNIDLALTPKGTGVLAFGTYTAGIVAQAGYITIKDSGGTTRRLLVG